MANDEDLHARLAKARDEYRKLLNRTKLAEAELRKKNNLIQWVLAALGGEAPPAAPSEGEAPEAGQVKTWIDDVVTVGSGKATDHVKRLRLLIDVARFFPEASQGRLVSADHHGQWVRLLDEIRTELRDSGVAL